MSRRKLLYPSSGEKSNPGCKSSVSDVRKTTKIGGLSENAAFCRHKII
jgi:hypothetical protein